MNNIVELNYMDDNDIKEMIIYVRRFPKTQLKVKLNLGTFKIITTLQRALVNSLIFKVLDEYDIPNEDFRKNFIFNGSFKKDKPAEYRNYIIDISTKYLPELRSNPTLFTKFLLELYEVFGVMVLVVDNILTLDHSLYNYILAYRNYPDFRKFIDEPVFDPSDNIYVINQKLKESIKVFYNNPINPIDTLLKSGIKINEKQIQMLGSWGPVPDYLNSNRILKPILNGVMNGFKTQEELMIAQSIARKVTSEAKQEIKKPGEVGKKLDVALSSVKLNNLETGNHVPDCNSTRHELYTIEKESDLKFYRFSYFLVEDYNNYKYKSSCIKTNDGRIYDHIDIYKKDLIGKTLKVRSIALCNTDTVCCVCTGANNAFVRDDDIVKRTITRMTANSVAGDFQIVISTKHHTTASPDDIYIIYNNVEYKFLDFIKKYDYIINMQFDRFILNSKKYKFNIVNENNEVKLNLDNGEEIIIKAHARFIDNENSLLIVNVPAVSVLNVAKDLLMVFNSHSGNKGDFKNFRSDIPLDSLTVDEKLRRVQDYIKTKLRVNHINHLEILTRALTRDLFNLDTRVRQDSKDVKYIHVGNLVSNNDYSDSLASSIIHGYINNNLNKISEENSIRADINDLLFQDILCRTNVEVEPFYNKLQDIINETFI